MGWKLFSCSAYSGTRTSVKRRGFKIHLYAKLEVNKVSNLSLSYEWLRPHVYSVSVLGLVGQCERWIEAKDDVFLAVGLSTDIPRAFRWINLRLWHSTYIHVLPGKIYTLIDVCRLWGLSLEASPSWGIVTVSVYCLPLRSLHLVIHTWTDIILVP